MTAVEKLKEVSALFKNAGIEDAAKEAEILITESLQINKSKLYTEAIEISNKVSQQIDLFVNRRIQGEPIQYIIGHVDFYGLKIYVGKGVLIPRPETELLVEEVIKAVSTAESLASDKENSKFKILDLCTGSGCIAIAIAKNVPQAIVLGVDKSSDAIAYAKQNALENQVKNVQFLQGNLFEPIKDTKFDYIVSNPPYIKSSEIHNLQKEIKNYEPIEALDGGEDGLDFFRRIITEAPYFLKKGGMLIMEIGHNQSNCIKELAKGLRYKELRFTKDYAGIERIFSGRLV